MIFSHKHIASSQKYEMKFGKTIKQITQAYPLIAICQKNTFLTDTIKKILSLYSIPHKISQVPHSQLEDGTKILDHHVPLFVFSNQILQKYQILEFLCDIAFGDRQIKSKEQNQYQFLEFTNRKNTFKDIATVWGRILNFQKYERSQGFQALKDLGVTNQQQYKNLIIQQIQNLSLKFKGKILSQSFSDYSQNKPCFENILFVDIIDSLERDANESIPYFYFRAYYQELLDIRDKLKKIIKQAEPIIRTNKPQIILDELAPPQNIKWLLLNINWERFIIAFGITSLIYTFYVKSQ